MKEFVLLISEYSEHELGGQDLEEMRSAYTAWMDNLITKDQYVYGNRLELERVSLTTEDELITDGPYVEPKEMIGGLVVVRALNINEAVEIARACPMHRYHSIDIRESRFVYAK